MIIELGAGDPVVIDGDDLGRLSVSMPGGVPVRTTGLVRPVEGDPTHVWLDVDELRRLAGAGRPDSWLDGYCRMVDYAAGHGWMDEGQGSIQAHITRSADPAIGEGPEAVGERCDTLEGLAADDEQMLPIDRS